MTVVKSAKVQQCTDAMGTYYNVSYLLYGEEQVWNHYENYIVKSEAENIAGMLRSGQLNSN